MGALKIHELRARAHALMGSTFDLRRFHEYLLEGGPMPIGVLVQHVACFAEGEKHQAR
ncbi:MAG: DUF885 family protein [Vicinamibacterales bacterium]